MSREAGERFNCPWCPTSVISVSVGSAMTVFERHLDEHYARQVAS